MVVLAKACVDFRDRNAAAVLYRYLEPFAGHVAMASGVAASYGSFAVSCGALAAILERWEEAERHFTAALAMNERLGARPWIVYTRRAYAEMLLDRDTPGDRERAAALIAAWRPSSPEQVGEKFDVRWRVVDEEDFLALAHSHHHPARPMTSKMLGACSPSLGRFDEAGATPA